MPTTIPEPEPEPEDVAKTNKTEEKDLDVSVKGPMGRLHTFKIPHKFIKALKEGT